MLKIGLDVGSTTLKCVLLDDRNRILYAAYERHFSRISEKIAAMLTDLLEKEPAAASAELCISGSAGMGIATDLQIPFVQEVYATRIAVNRLIPETDVIIELGGEDAKILFLTDKDASYGGLEVRMNGSCAGGTGAFIDQMSTLLGVTPNEMNEAAKDYQKIYTIASRCGVFAKSDIQPLLNQGAKRSDVSASIFAAVVNQTVGGLAQGRDIAGQVVYLGGPLTFLSELRQAFDSILGVKGICPEHSLYYVAMGAAFAGQGEAFSIPDLIARVASYQSAGTYAFCAPLFENQEAYDAFSARHAQNATEINPDASIDGGVFLGIDAGSTTVKAVVINRDEQIVRSEYLPNSGNPVPLIRTFLEQLYEAYPDIRISGAAVTGYGEEMIQSAFGADFGIVETVAHYTAAKKFRPDVDFIIDIGGQDIKCFKIRGGAIDNIFLNEACSSGCGSFLQTFAGALGYNMAQFAKLGLFAKKPVDLGSRCTVFMNSSVKQAQKDNAGIENISAGLSISVVKNALYKVIRAVNADSLGQHIVVQGGTFLNDAVLRAFEQEIGREVIRPSIAGLMGAYGAALYAKAHETGHSGLLTAAQLRDFRHEVQVITCGGCANSCRLTVNTFDGTRKFIGGNRCEKPLAKGTQTHSYNLYEFKRQYLASLKGKAGSRGRIGIPMGLNFYELLPFWHALFTKLGFEVVTSPASNRKLYLSGQHTIPSDTVCFPAKLLHGHIEALLTTDVDAIFYPCMTYNLDEGLGDNHYNCPVVAYYPEVIEANVKSLAGKKFIYDYIGIHRPKDFKKKFHAILTREFGAIPAREVDAAVDAAYAAHFSYLEAVRAEGEKIMQAARAEGLPIIVLSGRPYHLDPEINHGIDKLICACGAAVITEDAVSHHTGPVTVRVLNQWTYHSRLYTAAKYVADAHDPNLNLVQLVSFGCGVDAITTDEVRDILERGGKIYTQIKIDEITNLGAVKIRLRSLFAALQ